MEILLNVVLVGSFAIFTLALSIRMLRRTRKEPEMLELTEEEVDLVLLGEDPHKIIAERSKEVQQEIDYAKARQVIERYLGTCECENCVERREREESVPAEKEEV
tara:strand:+ start:618 stop:932 length:315 start_codon:yes stop_codon:yes gene_type:complete